MSDEHDLGLRTAAMAAVRKLRRRFDDLIPLEALREGFEWEGRRVSFGSFYAGIYRPKEMRGEAALAIVTTAPKVSRPAPYEDEFDEASGTFTYRFRDPQAPTVTASRAAERDNRGLIVAAEQREPLIYFRGIAPAQYAVVAPVFITHVDRVRRLVHFEAGLPVADMTGAGLTSDPEARRYATREAVYRLHQHRFRFAVLHAYSTRCAVCRLRESSLLQAAHIIQDRDEGGEATVVNGISLCAIHHLAYDRNVMGIDPSGLIHIAGRLLKEVDGPMLSSGLQAFHGARLLAPSREQDRPDPERLDVRFQRFRDAAA